MQVGELSERRSVSGENSSGPGEQPVDGAHAVPAVFNWPVTWAFTEMVAYASTFPMTWISTGTFFCPTVATVTGTSPPPPLRPPPPLPEGGPEPAAAAVLSVLLHPAETSRAKHVSIRIERFLMDPRRPHQERADLGIRLILYWRKAQAYSYAPILSDSKELENLELFRALVWEVAVHGQ